MKNNQYALKALLIIQTIGLLIYTVIAIHNDGGNFFLRAIEFSQSLKWIGQFTLDFNCYLILSALWIMWRNQFSTQCIAFGIIAMILGIIVFAPYLLYLISKEKGDLLRVIAGKRVH
ncbi:MAG: hypothetical protein NXI20_23155 [bacterium]|nr:hypothetical protein [bacterium]